jgi:hypothetical protein
MARQERKTRTSRHPVATSVAVTVITLSTALAAFSSAGLGLAGNRANVRDEPRTGATNNTAPGRSNPDATSAGQQPKELKQKLEEAADIMIQFDNSSDAPLVINAASIKAVKAPPSDPDVPPNRYFVTPDVLLQSATDKRVTGLVLSFVCGCSIADKTWSGEGELNLTPGEQYRFKMKPQWDVFTSHGDPNRIRVSVAAVLLEGEDLWVNVDQTRRWTEGTRQVRSEGASSKHPSSLEASSSSPGHDGKSESSASANAKSVTDVLCVGAGCPLGIIKPLGDIIGLPIVIEASAEARVRKGDAFYLRNLRRGDHLEILLRLSNLKYSRTGNQLNVKTDEMPESLYRLTLSK